LAIIFIVFAITGSASAKLAAPVLEFLGVQPLDFVKVPMGSLIYTLLRIMIIFPIYQILLIVVATIFFQFKFFWEFEKKFLSRIGLKFLFEKKNKD
jgi:hypothetical protein